MASKAKDQEQSWAEATCQLAGVLAPLAFHTIGTLGFESTKVLLVRLLALLLVLGWLGKEASRIGLTPGPFAWRRVLLDVWNGRLRVLALGVLAVGLTSALSTVTSVTPLVSLLGSWDRGQGLLTTLAWLVLGVAAALTGRDAARRRGLLSLWCVASAPVCLYAFVQAFHLDPISWLNQPLGVTSTLGASTALATYLAMLLPPTLACTALALDRLSEPLPRRHRDLVDWLADPRVRYGGWVALLLAQAAALAFTQVRGGLLAVGAGLLVTVGFVFWPSQRRLVSIVGGAALVALIVAGVLFAALPRPDVGDGADTSARQRFLIWQDAAQALAGPRLLIGYGPETQVLALEPHYPLELALRFENARFDRAHNLPLDTLLTSGLLGLGALLVALYGVFTVAVSRSERFPREAPSRWLAGGMLGGLAANLLANQFAFDTAATGVLFWLLAGLAVAPVVPPAPVYPPQPRPTRGQSRRKKGSKEAAGSMLAPAVRLRVTAWLAAAAVGGASLPWLTGPFLADLHHTQALAYRAGEAPGSAAGKELDAARAVPWVDVPLLAVADVYLDVARTSTLTTATVISSLDDLFQTVPSSRDSLFDGARVALERAVSMNPRDPYPHAYLARHWVVRAQASRDPAERTDFYGRAVEAYDRAIEAGPSRVQLYDEAGVALLGWGRPAIALDRFRQAEALSRPTAERLSRMADAVLAEGDAERARQLYQQALTLDDRSAPAEAGLAHLDRAAGNFPAALEHAQRAARFQMREWIYQRDLAQAYLDVGQHSEALAAARAARRLAPAWEQDALNDLIFQATT